jgi:CubicO group peptidase (beta-lactamase class C family)
MRAALSLFILLTGGCATAPPAPVSDASAPANRSYAWLSFDRSKVLRSGASGFADPARGRLLTTADPVRIASVSKLVVALGVMRLVEQGKLDLDRDVSDWLGWQLRNPAFPGEKITLRLLLSHRSSLRDEVDYIVPLGTDLRTALADPKAFDPERRPGTYFRYANVGFPVIASVMERASGERFDRLMEREVLRPLGLDACFNWSTCSDAAIARAATLYRANGDVARDDLGGVRPDCPVFAKPGSACDLEAYPLGSNGAIFSPQGGLRISAEGLAVIGQLLLSGGVHQGRRLVSQASIDEIVRPHWRFDGSNGDTEKGFYCAYGLGVQILPNARTGCRDDVTGEGRLLIGHAGDAYALKSGLWVDRRAGRGMAYFGTGIADTPPTGDTAYWEIERWLARKAFRP